MLYTKEDLEQAYIEGYNNACDELESMLESDNEYSLEDECNYYMESNEDNYTALEQAYLETSRANKEKHGKIIDRMEHNADITGKMPRYTKHHLLDMDHDTPYRKNGEFYRRLRKKEKWEFPHSQVYTKNRVQSDRMNQIRQKVKEQKEKRNDV